MARKICLLFFFIVVLLTGCSTSTFDCAAYVLKVSCGDGMGLGFATEDGYILTAAHILASTSERPLICTLETVDGHTYQAEIIAVDEERDLAALVNPLPHGLRLTDGETYSRLTVTGVGTVLTGNTTKKQCAVHGKPSVLLELDLYVERGMSGAPVTDKCGRVVGLLCARDVYGKHSYAVPTSTIKEFLSELK